ncbi:hormonally up-regulated neu tumor-associated kinase [Coregonus clupeaformis]|uniref:hormonally up-regulated neu tumor-associated kinase n=1 Tax=Coregonus clupeaformis TaxID=59861 RepID=UPI001BDFCE9B|nr:hormonally up-regulated neu tumor-associated kinase [Coregonus clupeaformis]
MFAMLTGTLPFTVEPFNIKQLHQKMVNGEIGTIPNDISKGAVGFVLSLLEPEPFKRPTIRSAMEEKWINEGYTKRPLHTLTHRNRLRPEDLNQSVLSYMTESLGYSLSDVINMLTNNRPSAVLASYHLLLSKLTRGQRGARGIKKLDTSEWNLPSNPTWREKSSTAARTQQHTEPANEKVSKQSSRPPRSQPQPPEEECLCNKRRQEGPPTESRPSSTSLPPCLPSPCPTPLIDEEITITLFPEVSVFGDRELVHLAPPKSSASKLCDSAPLPRLLDPTREGQVRPVHPPHALRTTHSDGAELDNSHLHDDDDGCHDDHVHHHRHGNNDRLKKLQTFYSSETKGGVSISPRMILETTEPRPSDREHLAGAMEMAQTAPPPLPQLRNAGLKEGGGGGGGRKVTWVGHMVRPQGPTGLLVNGSKPPAFPSQRQHALVIKSLRQERGRRGGGGDREGGGGRGGGMSGGVKRNSVQLRQSLQRRVADLNLPLLPAAQQRPY